MRPILSCQRGGAHGPLRWHLFICSLAEVRYDSIAQSCLHHTCRLCRAFRLPDGQNPASTHLRANAGSCRCLSWLYRVCLDIDWHGAQTTCWRIFRSLGPAQLAPGRDRFLCCYAVYLSVRPHTRAAVYSPYNPRPGYRNLWAGHTGLRRRAI